MRAINIYTAKLKTRAQIYKEIPRHLQGWWADVCPGKTLMLRDASASDLARCSRNAGSSTNPEDYLCELPMDGSLVSKAAIARSYATLVPVPDDSPAFSPFRAGQTAAHHAYTLGTGETRGPQ